MCKVSFVLIGRIQSRIENLRFRAIGLGDQKTNPSNGWIT